MIIRTQLKRSIVNMCNIDTITIENGSDILAWNGREKSYLGEYSTEEKAIKVLDMICDSYQYMKECECTRKALGVHAPEFVFQMPQDSEV